NGFTVFLSGFVVSLAKLCDQDRDTVDFLIVSSPVGENRCHAEPARLLAEMMGSAAEAPEHKVSLGGAVISPPARVFMPNVSQPPTDVDADGTIDVSSRRRP